MATDPTVIAQRSSEQCAERSFVIIFSHSSREVTGREEIGNY